jgi:hypothetical protein
MAANKELTEMRHKQVFTLFDKLANVKVNNCQKYNHDYILNHISTKTFYSVKYIEKLLKNRDEKA